MNNKCVIVYAGGLGLQFGLLLISLVFAIKTGSSGWWFDCILAIFGMAICGDLLLFEIKQK